MRRAIEAGKLLACAFQGLKHMLAMLLTIELHHLALDRMNLL
jgi:hypothetical protein